MTIPQIRECLRACDRRDAALGLQTTQAVHAAVAPLFAGKEGGTLFDATVDMFKRVFNPRMHAKERAKRLSAVMRQKVVESQERLKKQNKSNG